jgi:hypothetical protein
VSLLRAADECGYAGYADNGAAGGRLLGELGSGGVDGVVCAGEIGVEGRVPELGCDSEEVLVWMLGCMQW